MNEIMIALYDDSEADCSLLSFYLNKAAQELGRKLRIFTFQADNDLSKRTSLIFDMVFLSVSLSGMNTETAVRKLRNSNSRIHLVLLSDCPDSFALGYQYDAKNYLVKPFSYLMILNELKKYIKSEDPVSHSFLWISNRDGYFKLYHSRLRYIETENRYLIFHYSDQVIRYAGKISDFKETLPENIFFRCNNSYIVNLYYISLIAPEGNRYKIRLITQEILPLSRSRYRELLSKIT